MPTDRRAWLTTAILAGPFLAAFWAQVAGPYVSTAATPPPRMPLGFEQFYVDLRTIDPMSKATARYVFRNEGDTLVRVKSTTPSCACVTVTCDTTEIEPGTFGVIEAAINPVRESAGVHEYSIAVDYDDGSEKSRVVNLGFRVELPEKKLTLWPPNVVMIQFGETPPPAQIFTISDPRDKPLAVESIESSSPHVEVKLEESKVDESGVMRHKISARPVKMPPGKQEVAILIRTNDPDRPVLRAGVLLRRGDMSSLPIATKPEPRRKARR